MTTLIEALIDSRLNNMLWDLEGTLLSIGYGTEKVDREEISEIQKELEKEYGKIARGLEGAYGGSRVAYHIIEAWDGFMDLLDLDPDDETIIEDAGDIVQEHLIAPVVLAQEGLYDLTKSP